MKKLLILFLLPVQLAFSQQEIFLEDCYAHARENYPNLQQEVIWQQITAFKKENLITTRLPQVNLNLQATYQSDVPGLDIPIPNISIPKVSNDQYKAYIEFTQTIWDGGITSASTRLEDAILQSNLNQLEVELFRLNEQVSQTFFTILAVQKQQEVLQAQQKVITEKTKAAESAIKSGILEPSALLELRAEMLNLTQNKIQLDKIETASVQVLSILTGLTIAQDAIFTFQELNISIPAFLNRPEIQLFSSQVSHLDNQLDWLNKTRNPKLFGFGQAGYGRPGLNLLQDEFTSYYLVGLGLSWNIFDWRKTSRQKNVVQLQQEMIKKQEETFIQQIQILLTHQREQILKLESMLKTDLEMVALRSEIAAKSASKLYHETITTADYIRDLQAETVARLNHELHKIQLSEAKVKYNLIQGKTD
ncbi:MAG: TolC family protein [Mariniphaga sp.]|nr:TolC family protein [Mariniphaga sp.]MDD4425789.1 TolC family protein [Mariniphaga sp.]